VYWKQFAIDFDNVPLPAGPEAPDPTPEIWQAMQATPRACTLKSV